MKKRKHAFWGLHSDFHATPDFGTQGTNLREEDIREVCALLRPDYWQIDTKGHPGWASYPTELGNAMPEFACNTLEIWRRATAAEDVALFTHYSGVVDENFCAKHPEEAVMRPDGTRSKKAVRTNGNYADMLLIPQLSEMAEKYGTNGAWVDGDCWGVEIDYHPDTVAEFEAETGIKLNGKPPVSPEDEHFEAYVEFQRVLYRRYLKKYVDAIHTKFPDYEIASNWMYSDHSPEKITTDVDFLSGDFPPWNCANWARYAGRALAGQGLPWDLMAWGMRSGSDKKPDLLYVHTTQLLQDAAVTISIGGGFQLVVHQYCDGSPRVPQFRKLKPLADFMHARREFCCHGKLLHQAAMLLSSYDQYKAPIPYNRDNCELRVGMTALLCDAGQSLEVLSEHNLIPNADKFGMICVPEVVRGIAPETVNALLAYAENGGSLLLCGENVCRIFAVAGAPVSVEKPAPDPVERPVVQCVRTHDGELQRYFTLDGTEFGAVMNPATVTSTAENSETVASLCYNERAERLPFAVIAPYGKGKIAAIGANLGYEYFVGAQYLHRELIKSIAEKLYTPKAKIESALGNCELSCLIVDGKLTLQLTNLNGNHSNDNCSTENFIPPLLDVCVSIEGAPSKLTLQPEGKDVDFEVKNGRAYFSVPRIDVHCVVAVTE